MKVLSLFDGIACGRLAFERAGIPVEKYYASEIDKYAIRVAQRNFPEIIQIGDVTKLNFADYKDVDIIIGGSPCQGFSFAGKQLNFNDPRSKLFFEFVSAVKTIKPKYFLLENVKMKQEFQDIISEQLGVKPVEINSSLVSAQNRKRLYWTNIPGITKPEDKGIMLKDIVHEYEGMDESTQQMLERYKVPFDKTLQIIEKEVHKGKVGYFRKDSQANRVYYIHDKAVTLCGDAGGGAAKMGQYLFGVITPDRVEKRQNGQRFNEGDKFYTLTAQDKHGVLIDGYIRKLTPIECERLQTLTNTKKYYTIEICEDHQKNCVNAEEENHNVQNAVGSVESVKMKESVLFVEKNSNANIHFQKNVALQNVQVFIGESQLVIRYQGDFLLNASFADLLKKFPRQKPIENFALLFVLIDIIKGKEIHNGKVELHQKEISLTQAKSGNVAVKLSGKEIMPLAEYAEKDTIILEKLLNATTSSRLNIKNTEQTLKTLFCYVASVIVSFIPKEIQRNCILEIQTETGYTFGISDSQRYKAIGNGWTVDVIAHILKGIK